MIEQQVSLVKRRSGGSFDPVSLADTSRLSPLAVGETYKTKPLFIPQAFEGNFMPSASADYDKSAYIREAFQGGGQKPGAFLQKKSVISGTGVKNAF